MAVEVDWSKPKRGCDTCDYPSWHVCTAGKPDLFPKLLREGRKRGPRKSAPSIDDEVRAKLSDAQTARWAAYREEMKELFDQVVDRYSKGDVSIGDVAREFNMARHSVRRALLEAQEEGRVVIRKRGANVRASA